jgi:hypothetical protein
VTPTPTNTPTPVPTLDPCYDETPYNGWLYHETCIPGVVSEEFWLSPNPQHFVGIATWYGEGVMKEVAANRGLSLDNVWGGVALMNCGDIGTHVWIKRGPQYEFEGPYIVVDCSKRVAPSENTSTGTSSRMDSPSRLTGTPLADGGCLAGWWESMSASRKDVAAEPICYRTGFYKM